MTYQQIVARLEDLSAIDQSFYRLSNEDNFYLDTDLDGLFFQGNIYRALLKIDDYFPESTFLYELYLDTLNDFQPPTEVEAIVERMTDNALNNDNLWVEIVNLKFR